MPRQKGAQTIARPITTSINPPKKTLKIRAIQHWAVSKSLTRSVVSAKCRIDDGCWRPMARVGGGQGWRCTWQSREATDGVHEVTVEAQSFDGRTAVDTITVEIRQCGRHETTPRMPGACINAIGSYPAKGTLGTQLGPNKNGRKW
jgi:3',5'-cyclic-AMP phosphodiesterase